MGNVFTISCDQTLSRCQNCICREAAYICELENNLDTLGTAMQQLLDARNDVMTRVIDDERRQMRRLHEVQGWLTRVDALADQVDQLLKKRDQLCLGGYCSRNCKSSYKFGKKVAGKLQLVATLKNEGRFEKVAERVLEDTVDEIPIDQSVIIGQQSIFEEVWTCLRQTEERIICLYGKGGIGKTTLLKQINNKLRHDHERGGFDVVIWVVVSKEPKLEKIQEDILKKISFYDHSWKDLGFEDRSQRISNILSQNRFALLMDDLWEPLNLTELGVPLSSTGISSKMIFTARSLHICGRMKVDKTFEVKCLERDDARRLFQEKVGRDILDSHSIISTLAEAMVRECDGLPLALITIGQAMAYKRSPEEWRGAFQLLRKSVSEFPGLNNEVYPRLKFSYDSLPDDNTRSCFLYCSLFPEDYKIHRSYLIDCWLSEGFLDDFDDSMKRYQGHSIIGILVRACLLEEEGEDCVKMHDVIRDMALWIARDVEREAIMVEAGTGLVRAQMIGKWEGIKRISLMKNKIEKISETPRCPQLLTLFLNFNNLYGISSGFFQYMPALRVLNLSYNDNLDELPTEISKLKSLQHLDLSGTAIRELREELKALEKLKCLNLENTLYLCRIPRQLISSFSTLHVLRMLRCAYIGQDSDCSEDFIDELHSLNYLNVLSITIGTTWAFRRFLYCSELQSRTQSLCLERLKDHKLLEVSFFVNLYCLDELQVLECECMEVLHIDDQRLDFKSIRESLGSQGLRMVHIESVLGVTDLKWLTLLPNLKHVDVSYCPDLKEIVNEMELYPFSSRAVDLNPFSRLETLQLQHLKSLTSIYPGVLPFPQLSELRVYNCRMLKKLPLDSNSANGGRIIIAGQEDWWGALKWNDKASREVFLPCFKSMLGSS